MPQFCRRLLTFVHISEPIIQLSLKFALFQFPKTNPSMLNKLDNSNEMGRLDVNTTGEQVIDQSEKDAIPSIFDYPFHLGETMNTLILSFQRFYSNFVVACWQRKSIPEAEAE